MTSLSIIVQGGYAHRRQLPGYVAHCLEAVKLAQVTGNSVLIAATYTRLGATGAKELNSDARIAEAKSAWHAASKK